ncbi:MAG: amylo-alpha-1,6-glucosidase [Actinomycetales bacterium]
MNADQHLAAATSLLAPAGWVYASSAPVDADDPGRFHCLFGRDSLIFALQVLPVLPEVASATLRALAEQQGIRDDPETEEQPGRILHEYRPVAPAWLVDAGWPVREGAMRYYGTSDATSWFLVLLDATGDATLQAELADARRRAGQWLDGALDAGGGLVRCGPRRYPGGLSQQGWRDCDNPETNDHGGGIVTEQARMPASPLADVDSQAAAVAALDALARLDPQDSARWGRRAEELRARLARVVGPEVMAIDGHDRPVLGAGSQLGWLLWADALDEAAATAAADRLTRPDVLTGHGVRTLADSHPGFLSAGYHRGGVWPFDSWFAWGGLRGIGHPAAEQLRSGVRAAVDLLGGYPELYEVDALGRPARISLANRVQAWTVGAMIAFDASWDGRGKAPASCLGAQP